MFAKKSLGQNFLRSKKAIADIVTAGHITPGDVVLEAGPGEGVLTEALLRAGARVVAVEKDRRLIPLLQEKFSSEITSGQLTLIEDDILEFSIINFQFPEYKVIANIPYYITGTFIRTFLEAQPPPTCMVILVQKEVAERVIARDGKESVLSISVKAYGTPRVVSVVKAGSFVPAPKVDSAILAIEDISKKLFSTVSEKKFFSLVKAGFAHKRKRLAGNVKSVLPTIDKTLERLGINGDVRPEALPVEVWFKLATPERSSR